MKKKNSVVSMKNSVATLTAVAQALPSIFIFEILYKIFIMLLVQPVIRLILKFAMFLPGYTIAFNGEILNFFLTIPGIIAGIIFVIIAAFLTYLEFSVIVSLAYSCIMHNKASIIGSLRNFSGMLKSLGSAGMVGFVLYAVVLMPLVDMGLGTTLIPDLSIPNFVTGELAKMDYGKLLLAALAIVLFLIFICLIFVIPVMALEGKKFGQAVKRNFNLLKVSGRRLVGIYGGYLLMWFVLYGLPRALLLEVFNKTSVSLADIFNLFGFSWRTVILALVTGFFFLAKVVLMPLLLLLVVNYYLRIAGNDQVVLNSETAKYALIPNYYEYKEKAGSWWRKLRATKAFKILSLPVLAFVLLSVFVSVFRILETAPGLHEPLVLSHRGSAYGVENTLEALEGAIVSGADYAEVDIVLSADNVPMVIHDTDLSRLAGLNKNVYDMTSEELAQIEVSQNGMTSSIPTLAEAIEYTRGRINLAIELKQHGKETVNFVDAVMAVVNAYDYAEECIFVSLEYNLIEELKEKYPKCTAGYCLFGTVGDLDPVIIVSMPIDFIVIEEWMATKSTIKDFRSAWLPVYVWTVNDAPGMERYLKAGAIGIVTDYPDIAREVIDEYNRTSNVVYMDESDWRD